MAIIAENITKIYGSQKALDNVSFHIRKGEIVGILGPNGAGKSTLMKIITCYKRQTSGSCTVCGYDVLEDALEIKKRIGYLPENNPLYPDMYVREHLEWVAKIYHLDQIKKRVDEMIEITGLGNEQHKKIGELSKGYRQRVGLANALIHEPDVLVLDEPTSGLDPNQLIDIRKLISDMGQKSTVLLSTHIMQEVEAMCQRVIIISHGIVKADDTIANLQKRFTDKEGGNGMSMEQIFHKLTTEP